MKFVFDWLSGIQRKKCLNIMVMYMYIAMGQRQAALWGHNLFKNINLLLIWSFVASFTLKMTL